MITEGTKYAQSQVICPAHSTLISTSVEVGIGTRASRKEIDPWPSTTTAFCRVGTRVFDSECEREPIVVVAQSKVLGEPVGLRLRLVLSGVWG